MLMNPLFFFLNFDVFCYLFFQFRQFFGIFLKNTKYFNSNAIIHAFTNILTLQIYEIRKTIDS
jgi:hypothetical protein